MGMQEPAPAGTGPSQSNSLAAGTRMVVGTGMGGCWDGGGRWVGTGMVAGTRMLLRTGTLPSTGMGGYQDDGAHHSRWVPGRMLALGPAGTGTGGHWGEGSRHQDGKHRRPQGQCQGSPGEGDALGHSFPPSLTWLRVAPSFAPCSPSSRESHYFLTPPGVPSPRGQPVPGRRHQAPQHPTACVHGEEQSCRTRPCHELLRQVRSIALAPRRAHPPLPLSSPPLGGCQRVGRAGWLWFLPSHGRARRPLESAYHVGAGQPLRRADGRAGKADARPQP